MAAPANDKPVDVNSWDQRWVALQEHLQILKDGLNQTQLIAPPQKEGEERRVIPIPRLPVLVDLLDGLLQYGEKQFTYFRDLTSNPDFAPTFTDTHHDNQDVTLSREYILRQIIDRVATDARVIMQAISQRVFYGKQAVENQDARANNIMNTLDLADRVAYASLQPAVESGILEKPCTALAYFMRDPQVRVIPYSNVALIGIPLTCINQPRDFLAIPHEVGHYVYWNAHVQGKRYQKIWRNIEHKLEKLPKDRKGRERKWLYKWSEEIFSDVYGALVGGASVALSFQQLANETDEDGFESDDGHHPTPALRAHVYFQTLNARGGTQGQSAAKELGEKWHRTLKDREASDEDAHAQLDSGSGKRLDQLIEELWSSLDPELVFDVWNNEERISAEDRITITRQAVLNGLSAVVDITLSELPPLKESNDLISTLRQYNPLSDREKEFDQLDQALNAVARAVAERADDFDSVNDPRPTWETWAANLHSKFAIEPTDDLGLLRTQLFSKWLAILRGDGWTTEGPHGRPNENQ